MNDPHVVALVYRVEHDVGVSYDGAAPLDFETAVFQLKVSNHRAMFKLKQHFEAAEPAVEKVGPFIEAWEMHAREIRPEDQFRLVFEGAEVIDLKPVPDRSGVVQLGQVTETDTALPIRVRRGGYPPIPEWLGTAMGNWGAQTLPSIRQEGHGIVGGLPRSPDVSGPLLPPESVIGPDGSRGGIDTETRTELVSSMDKAVEVLGEIRDALRAPGAADQMAQINEAWSSTPGMGHNNPPPDWEEAQAVVEQGIEALSEPELNVSRLRTVHPALKWVGERFTTFFDSFAKSMGMMAVPALLALIASKLPIVIEIFDKIRTLLGL